MQFETLIWKKKLKGNWIISLIKYNFQNLLNAKKKEDEMIMNFLKIGKI